MATSLGALLSIVRKYLTGVTGAPAVPDTGDPVGDANIGPALLAIDNIFGLLDGQTIIGATATAALSNPASAPVLTPTTGGSLVPGDYQVGITYKNAYGETQSSTLANITLGVGETAIHIDALTLPGGVTGVNRYLSDAANSLVLRKQSTASTGAAYTMLALPGGTDPTLPGSNTTASNNHAEKGTPGAGTGLSVTTGPGSFVYAYDPSGPVDQNGYPLLRLKLEAMADVDFPTLSGGDAGRIIYGMTSGSPFFWDGASWAAFSSGGSLSDATSSVKGVLKLAKDLGGTAALPVVTGLQGRVVDTTAPTNGQVLAWNSSTSKWAPAAGASSNATSIRGVNVTTTTPTTNQALVYNGTSYTPQTIVPTSGNATSVAGITIVGTPTTDQILRYNSTDWVPSDVIAVTGNASSIGGFTVGTATPADTNVLTYVAGSSDWEPQPLPDATTGAKGVVQLAGDLANTAAAPQVAKIQGVAISGTPTTGDVLTATGSAAAHWAAPGGGGGTAYYTKLTMSGDFTMTGGSQAVYFDTLSDNTGTALWNGSNVLQNTTGSSGLFQILVSTVYQTNSTGERILRINDAFGTAIAYDRHVAVSGLWSTCQISFVMRLANSDTVDIIGDQTSGGSLDIRAGQSYAIMYKIG